MFGRKIETIEINSINECKLIIKPKKKLTIEQEKRLAENIEELLKSGRSSLVCEIDFDILIIKTK
jgi:uncharacterized protein (DUF488 family)